MDNNITVFNREEYLKTSFNGFWNGFFSNSVDYYSLLNLDDLIKLKATLSSINNIITLKLTLQAAAFLYKNEIISLKDYKVLVSHINLVKPNANGYDIEEEFDGRLIIGEVKANIPCGSPAGKDTDSGCRLYGANQLNNIMKDVRSLVEGKHVCRLDSSIKSALKFMFLLNCNDFAIGQITKKASVTVKRWESSDLKSLSPDVVYLVPLDILKVEKQLLAGNGM